MSTIWDIRKEVATPQSDSDFSSYSVLTQKILGARGLTTDAQIQKYLFPAMDDLYDPMLMKGIDGASKRILRAIQSKRRIFIHGDYDADGITGASILSRMLEKLSADYIAFLPDRKKDGYGVNVESVHLAKAKGASLFITVDCGIVSFEETKKAKEYGMEVIIIDHHRIHDGVPDADEVINPLQEDCEYPFKELSAGGLAFKLAQSLLGRGAFELLDLAALSTICDIAPLKDENRVIVHYGLKQISKRHNLGFKNLCEVSRIRRQEISAVDVAFTLGPRINAAGRIGSAERALKMLITRNPAEAQALAEELNSENTKRQKEDRQLLKQAIQVVEREINFNRDKVIVVSGEGWHEGVIGIVAQRLVERYKRPAIVIAFDGDTGKGSGRSVKGFHLFDGFSHCADTLVQFGGHELAAGLAIKKSEFKNFRTKLNEFAKSIPAETFQSSIRVDLEVNFSDITPQFLREMSYMEPFGAGNKRPVFLTRNVKTKKGPEATKSGGLRWWVEADGAVFEAVWNSKREGVVFPESEPYTIVFSPKLKKWDGIETLILNIKDAKANSGPEVE